MNAGVFHDGGDTKLGDGFDLDSYASGSDDDSFDVAFDSVTFDFDSIADEIGEMFNNPPE